MYLKSIKILNFRNISEENLTFHPKMNYFWGRNGNGKTNFLESIYFTSNLKPIRDLLSKNLIFFQESFFSLYSEWVGVKEDRVSIQLNGDKKQILWNQDSIKNVQEYLYNFKTMLFSPDDLLIIKGEPEKRRKFFDKSIFQISKNYYLLLKEYEHFLKMRNQLLKEPLDYTKKQLLDVIDEKFSSTSISIFKQRVQYIKKVTPFLDDILKKLTGGELFFKINYNTEFDYSSEEIFLKNLRNSFFNESTRKRTLSGIHLDDFSFIRDGKNIRNFGSQGEIRLSILALKIAHINYIFHEIGEYPILLLDDLFSELDINRKEYLLKFLQNEKAQTFITSTEIDNSFLELFSENFQKFRVMNGKIDRDS